MLPVSKCLLGAVSVSSLVQSRVQNVNYGCSTTGRLPLLPGNSHMRSGSLPFVYRACVSFRVREDKTVAGVLAVLSYCWRNVVNLVGDSLISLHVEIVKVCSRSGPKECWRAYAQQFGGGCTELWKRGPTGVHRVTLSNRSYTLCGSSGGWVAT